MTAVKVPQVIANHLDPYVPHQIVTQDPGHLDHHLLHVNQRAKANPKENIIKNQIAVRDIHLNPVITRI